MRVFILLAVIFFGPIISKVPMAALAALLLVVAFHMSEIHRVRQMLRLAPRSDHFGSVRVFHLDGVFRYGDRRFRGDRFGGFALSFAGWRGTRAGASWRMVTRPSGDRFPKTFLSTKSTGPLFFGAVENAIGTLRALGQNVRSVVLLMEGVPTWM
jgi:SulP family sulfate permease